MTKKENILADESNNINARPNSFLNIPIRRELRNRLKAQAALSGKSLYDYCTEILEKALQNRNDEGDKK